MHSRRSQQTVMVSVVCAIWGAAAIISIPPLAGWNRYIYEVREGVREGGRERGRHRCVVVSKLEPRGRR